MRVRPAAVAGLFYPGDPNELQGTVEGFLHQARVGEVAGQSEVDLTLAHRGLRALIVPHAGYVYSGATAALAYLLAQALAETVRHVIIVGPAHRVGIRGVALPEAAGFATPLGVVPLWEAGVEIARAQPLVVESAVVHAEEHSLEVQLPFLQTVLPGADILPLAVGWVDPSIVSCLLDALWGQDTLVVVSSDLSHYHPWSQARLVDAATVRQICDLDPEIGHEQACGATGVAALCLAGRERALRPQLLGSCNSGDTAGDKSRVVGYAAFAFNDRLT